MAATPAGSRVAVGPARLSGSLGGLSGMEREVSQGSPDLAKLCGELSAEGREPSKVLGTPSEALRTPSKVLGTPSKVLRTPSKVVSGAPISVS